MATITIRAGAGVAKIDLRQSNGVTATIYENDQYSWTRLDSNSWISVEDVDALPSYSNPYTDNYGNNLNSGHTYYFSGGDQSVTVRATYVQPVVTYTLSFNPGAADATGSMTAKTGATSYIVPRCGFDRDGYEFKNWVYTDDDGYPQTKNVGDTITLTRDLTLYAQWVKPITVTLRSKGTTYKTYNINSGEGISLPDLADTESQRFEYWYDVSSGEIYHRSYYYFYEDTILDAQWTDKEKIILTLRSHGEPYSTITIYEDGEKILPTPDSTATEKFEYWYRIDSEAAIETYEGGASVEFWMFDGDTTLYAAWETIYYSITYNGNNATSGSTAKQEGSSTYTIRQNGFQRTGYAFQYWTYSDEYDQEHIYRPGDQVTPKRNMTLYAFWLRAYTITYHANGGTGAPSEQTKIHNVDLTLSSTVPTRSGYDFVNWYDGTDYYSPGGTYTANSPASLYAQWRLKTYTITYNLAGGGGGPTSPDTKTHGTTYTIPSTKPTKTGNTFQHWVDDLDNSYDPGESYYRNANTTFTAVWKLNEYDVTYYANGGSGAPDKQKKIYGQDLTLSTVKPTRANYVFLGWARNSAATTAQYQPGDTYTDNKTLSLWAVWTAKTKFYWHGNDAEDAKYFKVGERIDLAVTASAWNSLCGYINDVRRLAGMSTKTFTTVTAGQPIRASIYKEVRDAIYEIVLAGYGRHVPSSVSAGTEITTALFNGADGLKAAINSCMDDL